MRDRSNSRAVRPIAVALLVVALGVLGAGCGDDDDSTGEGSGKLVVNSFGGTWGEGIQLGFIDEFERETGIEVELLSTADVAKSKLAIESGNKPAEDIIDVVYSQTVDLEKDGLIEDLDIPDETLEQLDQSVRERYRDNATGITWGQFAFGLCYDKRKFPDGEPQPSNWADFWDVSKFPGKRGYPEWVIGAAEPLPELSILADGGTPEEFYPVDSDRVFAKLDELRPHVPKFASTAPELGQQLVDGSVAMEVCYTHRVNKLIDGGADFIGISFDQARLQGDQFVVWKDAPNKENAKKFIDFILQKEQQARWARIGYTAPVNPRAFEELPKEVADRIATSPANRKTTFVKDEQWFAEEQDGETNFDRLVKEFEEWQKR